MRRFANGMFGPIHLVDRNDRRMLVCKGEVQGGAFLEPPASFVDPDAPEGPGPVSSSPYALGWLLGGLCCPSGSGLMIGLGSGAGAIQLLDNFPGLDLTVVDIDPKIVGLALDGFPLLRYYLDQGRLNIKIVDADNFVDRCEDHWDLAFADAYTGDQGLVCTYLRRLATISDRVYLNCIGAYTGKDIEEICLVMEQVGKPVAAMMHTTVSQEPSETTPANWILMTEAPSRAELEGFFPNYGAVTSGFTSAITACEWWTVCLDRVFRPPV